MGLSALSVLSVTERRLPCSDNWLLSHTDTQCCALEEAKCERADARSVLC